MPPFLWAISHSYKAISPSCRDKFITGKEITIPLWSLLFCSQQVNTTNMKLNRSNILFLLSTFAHDKRSAWGIFSGGVRHFIMEQPKLLADTKLGSLCWVMHLCQRYKSLMPLSCLWDCLRRRAARQYLVTHRADVWDQGKSRSSVCKGTRSKRESWETGPR